jgi:hypothetical protein
MDRHRMRILVSIQPLMWLGSPGVDRQTQTELRHRRTDNARKATDHGDALDAWRLTFGPTQSLQLGNVGHSTHLE